MRIESGDENTVPTTARIKPFALLGIDQLAHTSSSSSCVSSWPTTNALDLSFLFGVTAFFSANFLVMSAIIQKDNSKLQ